LERGEWVLVESTQHIEITENRLSSPALSAHLQEARDSHIKDCVVTSEGQDYRIVDTLGHGRDGTVLLIEETDSFSAQKTGRPALYAMKVFREHTAVPLENRGEEVVSPEIESIAVEYRARKKEWWDEGTTETRKLELDKILGALESTTEQMSTQETAQLRDRNRVLREIAALQICQRLREEGHPPPPGVRVPGYESHKVLYESDPVKHSAVVLMEYFPESRTLRNVVEQMASLAATPEHTPILKQVCSALVKSSSGLHYLMDHGIFQEDFHLGQVLVCGSDPDGDIALLDFGQASLPRLREEQGATGFARDFRITQAGILRERPYNPEDELEKLIGETFGNTVLTQLSISLYEIQKHSGMEQFQYPEDIRKLEGICRKMLYGEVSFGNGVREIQQLGDGLL
jgi:hypothetical protein